LIESVKPLFDGTNAKKTAAANQPGRTTLSNPSVDGASADWVVGDEAVNVDHGLWIHTLYYVVP
jgi:hypothetical protein